MDKRETFTLDDVDYYVDSLGESESIINDISIIDSEINHLEVKIGIANVAKQSFVTKLKDNISTFEKVESDK